MPARPPLPLIDVLIPVFNSARTVRSAIESIQRQTVRDIRIVVVNDGSTDTTADMVAAMAREDGRIELFDRPNGGIVDALNFGLAQCRAEFVARHDGDDLALPDRFAKQVGFLRANPGSVAVGGWARHIDADGQPLNHIVKIRSPDTADPTWAPTTEPYIIHPFLMARTAPVQAVGGYRHVYHAEDTDLYWRLQEAGSLHNLPEVLGDYRMHAASVTSVSIINGRVSALSSQLAALSALRRRAGRPDLAFPKEANGEYVAARSLDGIVRLGTRQLDPAEADWTEVAVAGKLMELSSYRPFELELEDCRFIRRAVDRHAGILKPRNRTLIRRMCAGAAGRLASKGRLEEAAALIGPRFHLGVATRVAYRRLVPRTMRLGVLRVTGRGTPFK